MTHDQVRSDYIVFMPCACCNSGVLHLVHVLKTLQSTILQLNKPVFEILKFTLGNKITGKEAKEMHFYSLNLHLFVCFFIPLSLAFNYGC